MTLLFYMLIELMALFLMKKSDDYAKHSLRAAQYAGEKRLSVSAAFMAYSFLVLFFLLAVRDSSVGKDYVSYAEMYLKINSGAELTSVQKEWLSVGYQFLCRVIGLFGKTNYRLMFAVVGFLSLYLMYGAISRVSVSRWQSLFLFISFCLYYQFFNQTRQMLALCMTTYASACLMENTKKGKIQFFVISGLAVLIHTSAALIFALYFVKNQKLGSFKLLLYITIACCLYFFYDLIEKYVIMQTSYGSTYLGWAAFDQESASNTIMNLGVRLALLAGCLLVSKDTVKRAPYTLTLYNAVIICTFLQVLATRSQLFTRTTQYYYIFYIFLIPEALKTASAKFGKGTQVAIMVCFLLLFTAYHIVYFYSDSGSVSGQYGQYATFLF